MFRNEVKGPKLYFNEIWATKSIAKKEFQKNNFEIGKLSYL